MEVRLLSWAPNKENIVAKEEWYVQCRLTKEIASTGAVRHLVTWIPSKIALPGKRIRLQEDDGTWTEGWLVVNRGATKISSQKAATLAHGSKKFKENTDI